MKIYSLTTFNSKLELLVVESQERTCLQGFTGVLTLEEAAAEKGNSISTNTDKTKTFALIVKFG